MPRIHVARVTRLPNAFSLKQYITGIIAQRCRLPFSLSGVAVLALVVGLVGATAVFVGVRRLEHDKVELDFQQRANLRTVTLRHQLTETVQVLKFLNQLFATFEPVSRDQFGLFTDPLLQRHPYVQAFNFHRIVPGSERKAYEARMQTRFPGFVMTRLQDGKVVPASARERHLVVDYIEPMHGNEAAFGMDVSHNQDLIATLERAIDTGTVSSTGLITLAQGGGKLRGFLVLMPVYRHGMPLN